MYGQLCSLVLIVLSIPTCFAQWDSGAGILYQMQVVEDVWLEGSSNFNNYPWLIVGQLTNSSSSKSALCSDLRIFPVLVHTVPLDLNLTFTRKSHYTCSRIFASESRVNNQYNSTRASLRVICT